MRGRVVKQESPSFVPPTTTTTSRSKDNYTKILDKVKKEQDKSSLLRNEVNSYTKDAITVSDIYEEKKRKRGRQTMSISTLHSLRAGGGGGWDADDDSKRIRYNEPLPAIALLQNLIQSNDPFLCRATPSSVAKDYFNDDEQHKMMMCKGGNMNASSSSSVMASTATTLYDQIKPLITLWDYQEDTLQFLADREIDTENVGCFGAMVCHDMGLGKTPITLCHQLRDNQKKSRLTGERFNGPTIILCKTILVPTWKAEIEKSFPKNTFVYYDLTDVSQLDHLTQAHIEKCCDIVFITYSMLLTTFLLITMPQKSEATIIEEVAREYIEEDNDIDDDDEEDEENVTITTTTTTTTTERTSTTTMHNMVKRQKTIEKHEKLKMLFRIVWTRVVTDESQQFVNKKTKLFQAVTSLKARSKWVVSGTPIQNSLDNIYACFEFIGVNDNQYGNMVITKNTTKEEEKLNEARIKDILSKVMTRLVKSDSLLKKNNVLTCKGIDKQTIFINFETKLEHLVYLLYASYGLHNLNKCPQNKKKTTTKKSGGKDYHNKVTYIIQLMRQLCISFRIVKNLILPKGMLTMSLGGELMLKDTGFNELLFDDDKSSINAFQEDENHHYCNDLCQFSASMNRHTVFQYKSALSSMNDESITWNPYAPSKEFSLDNESDRALYELIYNQMKVDPNMDFDITNRKCHAMMNHIKNRTLSHASTKDIHIINYIRSIQDPTDKIIIFSDYVKALECLSIELDREGFKYAIVTGNKIKKGSRIKKGSNKEQLEIFKTDPTVKILLLSLKLGNNGLNLSCANHIIFYSKWWNPHIEQQAQDRIIRIGQSKMVYIRHFIINGTIEEYILKLSDNKKKISATLIKPVEEQEVMNHNDDDVDVVVDDTSINNDVEERQINKFKDQLFNFDIKVIRQ